ncbi:hypothetical protein ACFL2D_00830 [Patescibacteria group bacterium]
MPDPESPEQFEARREALFEKLDLKGQHESQLKVLNEAGILELLPESGDMGIVGVDGKEYPVPTLGDIKERLKDPETLEMIERKHSQGFNKMLFVPFGLPIPVLIDRYEKIFFQKHNEGKLTTSDGEIITTIRKKIVATPPDMDIHKEGQLSYYPKIGEEVEAGKSKKELVNEGLAWDVVLVEDLVDFWSDKKAKKLGGRRQTRDVSFSIPDLRERIKKDPSYQNEIGFTPEAWLALAISVINEKNMQIDEAAQMRLFGAHDAKNRMPVVEWAPRAKRVEFTSKTTHSFAQCLARTAVRLDRKE